MTKLEITQKGDCLCHAHIAIGLEAHISDRSSRIEHPHNVLGDYV